jgi:hypothetical protein
MDRQAPRPKTGTYPLTADTAAFTRPMPPRVRMLVAMVSIALDMTQARPVPADTASRPVLADTASRPC